MLNESKSNWDDFKDDIPFASGSPKAEVKATVLHKETCKKCGGSGMWHGFTYSAKCFSCGGKGYNEYKTSPEYRQQRAKNTAAKKVAIQAQRAQESADWHTRNPEMSAFLRESSARWDFAAKMLEAVGSYGGLTEGQFNAVQRSMERDAERKAQWAAERAAKESAAPVVDATKLEDAFATAKENGLKWPKITIGSMKVSPASETSKNAGALYVKEGDTYLGKVLGGKFFKSRDCGDEQEGVVVGLINDPKGYAEAYGLKTGNCCICNRELTNKQSIARGIGPICADKFGW